MLWSVLASGGKMIRDNPLLKVLTVGLFSSPLSPACFAAKFPSIDCCLMFVLETVLLAAA